MKIQVKHNLIIFREPYDWLDIKKELIAEYGPSIMISWKTKRELGFTVRHHKGLVKHSELLGKSDYHVDSDLRNRFHYEDQIHLDFYSESALTYFLLKYANNKSGVDI